MRRFRFLLVLFVAAITVLPRLALGAPPPRPKLVLAIVIDQFRYDYLLPAFAPITIRGLRACWSTGPCLPTRIICTRPQ